MGSADLAANFRPSRLQPWALSFGHQFSFKDRKVNYRLTGMQISFTRLHQCTPVFANYAFPLFSYLRIVKKYSPDKMHRAYEKSFFRNACLYSY